MGSWGGVGTIEIDRENCVLTEEADVLGGEGSSECGFACPARSENKHPFH